MQSIHILPAAGSASRLNGIPKFLLPITTTSYLFKYHMNLISSELDNIDLKFEVACNKINYPILNSLNIIDNLKIIDSKSMVETVKKLVSTNSNKNIIYSCSMPDTYFSSKNSFNEMRNKLLLDDEVDVVLGLWKMEKFQKGKFGQVELDKSNEKILQVVDKDPNCKFKYFWGTLMWNSVFNNFMHESDQHFGISINRAIKNGINIGFHINDGPYYDCGTFEEYKKLLLEIKY